MTNVTQIRFAPAVTRCGTTWSPIFLGWRKQSAASIPRPWHSELTCRLFLDAGRRRPWLQRLGVGLWIQAVTGRIEPPPQRNPKGTRCSCSWKASTRSNLPGHFRIAASSIEGSFARGDHYQAVLGANTIEAI